MLSKLLMHHLIAVQHVLRAHEYHLGEVSCLPVGLDANKSGFVIVWSS